MLNVFKITDAVADTCTRLTATISDESTIAVSKNEIEIKFSTDDDKNIGRIYSDPKCKSPTTAVTLQAGEQSVSFWVKIYKKYRLSFSGTHGPDDHFLQINTP